MNEKEFISYPFIFEIKKDTLYQRIDLIGKKEFPHNRESLGFNNLITETKNKIENLSVTEWNKIRKIINPFDFPNIFNSKLKIFNRAFYKFWEIFHQFNLDEVYQKENRSLHLAEAPGSFIHTLLFKNSIKEKENLVDQEGFVKVKSKKKIKKNKYIDTISINRPGFPRYNDQIENSSYVNFLGDKIGDKTGDICKKINFCHLISSERQYQLITADGGIDEKGYYDSKEQIHLKLFLIQTLIALNTQKERGVFIMKIYDIYTQPTIDLIWLLSQFYQQVHLYKPLTSRITNSEKYLICKNFIATEINISNINRLTEQVVSFLEDSEEIHIINFEVRPKPSLEFKEQFKALNKSISSLQIESIDKALNLVDKPIKKDFLEEQNILKTKNFIKWQNTFHLWDF